MNGIEPYHTSLLKGFLNITIVCALSSTCIKCTCIHTGTQPRRSKYTIQENNIKEECTILYACMYVIHREHSLIRCWKTYTCIRIKYCDVYILIIVVLNGAYQMYSFYVFFFIRKSTRIYQKKKNSYITHG